MKRDGALDQRLKRIGSGGTVVINHESNTFRVVHNDDKTEDNMKVGFDYGEEYTMMIDAKKVDDLAQFPTRGSELAAGHDLYAHIDCEELLIQPNETIKIGTGVCVQIPQNHFGAVCARSGIATKKGLAPINAPGIIDADYTGEVIVALHNFSTEHQTIVNGERIAQLIIMEFKPVEFNEVDELRPTERGDGGFGSTGRE